MPDDYYDTITIEVSAPSVPDAATTLEWEAGSSLTDLFDLSDVRCEVTGIESVWLWEDTAAV